MSTFALAYEDYVKTGVWDATGYESVSTDVAGPGTKDLIGAYTNLADMRLSVVCGGRTTGGDGDSVHSVVASNVWDESLAAPLPLQIMSLLDIRLTEATDGDFSLNFEYLDTAGDWQPFAYEDPTYPTSDFVRHTHAMAAAPVQACGARIEVIQNGGSRQWTAGRFWAGPLLIPDDGITNDWLTSIIDPGKMEISRGGQGYPTLRQRRRRLEMNLTNVDEETAFGNEDNTVLDLQQLGFRVGTTSPVIAFPRTRDATGTLLNHLIHRLGIYGHLAESLVIRHVTGPYFTTRLLVDELL